MVGEMIKTREDNVKRNKPKYLKLIEFLKKFLIVYGCLVALMPALQWSQDILPMGNLLSASLSVDVLKALGVSQRLVGWLLDSLGSAIFMIVLISLYKLLDLIRKRQPFSTASIALYEKISRFYLFSIIYEPISRTAMSIVTTWHLPVGQRTLSVTFGTDNINSILLALCLYLIVFLIKQAHQISEEQRMVI
jgi:hypothetical protein